MEPGEQELIEAAHDHELVAAARTRLAEGDALGERSLAAQAVRTCELIGAQVHDEIGRLSTLLAAEGLSADIQPAADGGNQIHAMATQIADFDKAQRLADLVGTLGYRRWEPWTGGARASFRRVSDTMTLALARDVTYVLVVRWPSAPHWRRVPRVLRPTAADWAAVDLPPAAWPLYFVLRPVRLLAERLGVRAAPAGHLGPFLTTPASLIDPLLSFASVSADDVVFDLGCGDGRLVIEAARRRGCRARGIESDPELAELARGRVRDAGLEDRVGIVTADAEQADLAEASVVFLFLPADVTTSLLPALLDRLGPGARVVAHEQHRLETSVPTDESSLLVGGDGITVAHRWLRGPSEA